MFRFQITPRPSWLRPPRCGSVFHARTSDRKSTRLNSSHSQISYAVFCLKKKKTNTVSLTRHHHTQHIKSPTSHHFIFSCNESQHLASVSLDLHPQTGPHSPRPHHRSQEA